MPQHRRALQRLGAGQQAQRRVAQELRPVAPRRAVDAVRRQPPAALGCRRGPRRGWPRRRTPAGAGRVGIDTAYRSYDTQKALYAKYLALRGRTWTDTWYLRAGYSEHQTGLTVDLLPIGRSNCRINDCIDETPQGVWLARNAWRLRLHPALREGPHVDHGVGFEPWHFRYVGTALAKAYHDGGWHTYEQFLGEPAAPTY